MKILQGIVIALTAGTLGLFAIGLLGDACAKWYRVSNFEGGAG